MYRSAIDYKLVTPSQLMSISCLNEIINPQLNPDTDHLVG